MYTYYTYSSLFNSFLNFQIPSKLYDTHVTTSITLDYKKKIDRNKKKCIILITKIYVII